MIRIFEKGLKICCFGMFFAKIIFWRRFSKKLSRTLVFHCYLEDQKGLKSLIIPIKNNIFCNFARKTRKHFGNSRNWQQFTPKVACRRASLAGLGLEDAAGAAQRASGSLPGAPKRRKKILLVMEKRTHAKNNKITRRFPKNAQIKKHKGDPA